MVERIAIFPGSFDPITSGHYNIIIRSLAMFDKLIVAVGINSDKKYMFSVEQRVSWLEQTFSDFPQIQIDTYEGLTVDYCKKVNSKFILRGLRNPADFEFEKNIAHINKDLSKNEIETVFLLTAVEKSYVSSSSVREVIKNNGDFSKYVPTTVKIL